MPESSTARPLVGVIMGSRSDWETMAHAVRTLVDLGVPHEARVVSAHRTPDLLFDYAESAVGRGLKVIIAGAGGAAHLPGMCAAKTRLPVLGVPVQSKALSGNDSLLSIVQMPAGIPVGTLAIGRAGELADISGSLIISGNNETAGRSPFGVPLVRNTSGVLPNSAQVASAAGTLPPRDGDLAQRTGVDALRAKWIEVLGKYEGGLGQRVGVCAGGRARPVGIEVRHEGAETLPLPRKTVAQFSHGLLAGVAPAEVEREAAIDVGFRIVCFDVQINVGPARQRAEQSVEAEVRQQQRPVVAAVLDATDVRRFVGHDAQRRPVRQEPRV